MNLFFSKPRKKTTLENIKNDEIEYTLKKQ